MKPCLKFNLSLLFILLISPIWGQNTSVEVDDETTKYVILENGLPFPNNQKKWWETGNGGSDFIISHFDFQSDFIAIRTDLTILESNGNVGIGVSNPTANLHTGGSVRFELFGAGTLQTDAMGNLSVSSDARLKNIAGSFTYGLDAIQKLNPVRYKWKADTGLDSENIYAGFIAQEVQEVIPEAVGQDSKGYLTLSDRPIIAALVNAVKELRAENQELRSMIDQLKVSN